MQIVLLLGLILVSALAAGRAIEKVGIPHVVGYILVGVILGDSVTHLIPGDLLDNLSALTSIALAFIGFMVGGELKYSVFKKYSRQPHCHPCRRLHVRTAREVRTPNANRKNGIAMCRSTIISTFRPSRPR